jgi:hypothetical protein
MAAIIGVVDDAGADGDGDAQRLRQLVVLGEILGEDPRMLGPGAAEAAEGLLADADIPAVAVIGGVDFLEEGAMAAEDRVFPVGKPDALPCRQRVDREARREMQREFAFGLAIDTTRRDATSPGRTKTGSSIAAGA